MALVWGSQLGPGDRCAEGAAVTGHASCADVLTVGGRPWTSWTLADDLDRDLVGQPRTGVQRECEDHDSAGRTCGSPEEPGPATLRRIQGIPGSQALAREGYPRDVIYVPGDPLTSFRSLPRRVQRLIEHG
ncbi:hypothetical protein GCM10009844_38810 [Nocardioides koreensis]|uniref:Uncharacterized protein n=1 Tax=Nocardioides koreensis TaxID=433651 RepID=A0ABN3A4P0_9ACTN